MKQILVVIGLMFFVNLAFAQMNISEQELQRYLDGFGVAKSDFSSEEEMTLYFVDNIEKIGSFYYLAAAISAIPNKSPKLLDAIQKKLLQCLIESNKKNASPFTGILNGFCESSPTGYTDYVLFFENLLAEDSKYNQEAYLHEIALSPMRKASELFTLEDRIKILSAKILLMFDAKHSLATRFFLEYPIEVREEPVEDCFVFKENEWSGYGIIGSDGKWLLPPFYQFYFGVEYGFSESWLNFYVINKSYRNDQRPADAIPSFALGSWVNNRGQLMTKDFVNATNMFKSGSARFGSHPNYKYINSKGEIDKVKSESTFRILKDGYELKNIDNETHIYNPSGEQIASLPKEFGYAEVLKEDGLIGFADIPGFPGEALAGYMNMQGNILVQPRFLINSDHGYSFPSFNDFDFMVVRDESRLAGLVDKNFDIIIPMEYDHLWIKNSKYILGEQKGKLILLNSEGDVLTQPDAEKFRNYEINCKGEYCFSRIENILKIADLEGEVVSGFDDYNLKGRFDNIFICEKENRFGAFDENLNQILSFEHSKAYALPENKIMYSGKNGFQCKWLDSGEVYDFPSGFYPDVISNPYAFKFSGSFIPGNIKGKTGIVNTKGEIVMPFDYYYISLNHIPEK